MFILVGVTLSPQVENDTAITHFMHHSLRTCPGYTPINKQFWLFGDNKGCMGSLCMWLSCDLSIHPWPWEGQHVKLIEWDNTFACSQMQHTGNHTKDAISMLPLDLFKQQGWFDSFSPLCSHIFKLLHHCFLCNLRTGLSFLKCRNKLTRHQKQRLYHIWMLGNSVISQ